MGVSMQLRQQAFKDHPGARVALAGDRVTIVWKTARLALDQELQHVGGRVLQQIAQVDATRDRG